MVKHNLLKFTRRIQLKYNLRVQTNFSIHWLIGFKLISNIFLHTNDSLNQGVI